VIALLAEHLAHVHPQSAKCAPCVHLPLTHNSARRGQSSNTDGGARRDSLSLRCGRWRVSGTGQMAGRRTGHKRERRWRLRLARVLRDRLRVARHKHLSRRPFSGFFAQNRPTRRLKLSANTPQAPPAGAHSRRGKAQRRALSHTRFSPRMQPFSATGRDTTANPLRSAA
jgi:hypothetical protein